MCEVACVFKARNNPQFHCPGNLKEWLVLGNKLSYPHTNVKANVEPHRPSVLSVFPTQKLKYVRFFKEYGVCGKNKESTSYKNKLVISMIKFFQKGDYDLSLMRVAHCFLVGVEIKCGVDEKRFVT